MFEDIPCVIFKRLVVIQMTTLCMYVNTKPILGHKPEKEFLSLTIGITHIKKKKKSAAGTVFLHLMKSRC